jgi:hypothetical protein
MRKPARTGKGGRVRPARAINGPELLSWMAEKAVREDTGFPELQVLTRAGRLGETRFGPGKRPPAALA